MSVAQINYAIHLLFISGLFFTLSMISYYAGQILIPIFVAGLFWTYRRELTSLISQDKLTLVYLTIILLIQIPILLAIFSQTALVRFNGTSTFKPEAHPQEFADWIEQHNNAVQSHNLIGTLIYNRRLFPVKVFLEGYVSHYSWKWLFTNGPDEPFKAPYTGLFYMWQIPFILLGIYAFFRNSGLRIQAKQLIFIWLIFSPLPASVATQAPHAMRAYPFLIPWLLLCAQGVVFMFSKWKRLFGPLIVILLAVAGTSLGQFYYNYYELFPKEQSKSFHYAFSKALPYVFDHEKEFQKIVISNKDNLYQSYMLYLYYSRYDPIKYQLEGGTRSGGFAETHKIGKYEFRPITWSKEETSFPMLYVGNIWDFPEKVEGTIFTNLNNTPAIEVVAKK